MKKKSKKNKTMELNHINSNNNKPVEIGNDHNNNNNIRKLDPTAPQTISTSGLDPTQAPHYAHPKDNSNDSATKCIKQTESKSFYSLDSSASSTSSSSSSSPLTNFNNNNNNIIIYPSISNTTNNKNTNTPTTTTTTNSTKSKFKSKNKLKRRLSKSSDSSSSSSSSSRTSIESSSTTASSPPATTYPTRSAAKTSRRQIIKVKAEPDDADDFVYNDISASRRSNEKPCKFNCSKYYSTPASRATKPSLIQCVHDVEEVDTKLNNNNNNTTINIILTNKKTIFLHRSKSDFYLFKKLKSSNHDKGLLKTKSLSNLSTRSTCLSEPIVDTSQNSSKSNTNKQTEPIMNGLADAGDAAAAKNSEEILAPSCDSNEDSKSDVKLEGFDGEIKIEEAKIASFEEKSNDSSAANDKFSAKLNIKQEKILNTKEILNDLIKNDYDLGQEEIIDGFAFLTFEFDSDLKVS